MSSIGLKVEINGSTYFVRSGGCRQCWFKLDDVDCKAAHENESCIKERRLDRTNICYSIKKVVDERVPRKW